MSWKVGRHVEEVWKNYRRGSLSEERWGGGGGMQEDLSGVCRKREGGRERRMGVCYN